MPLGREVGLDQSDIVLDGDPAPASPKKMGTQLPLPETGAEPQFSAHIYCGQTAPWIKMPLGMEVGLGPGRIVFFSYHFTVNLSLSLTVKEV